MGLQKEHTGRQTDKYVCLAIQIHIVYIVHTCVLVFLRTPS